MYIELGNIFEIENIDEKIDNSFNGTCFAYSWFFELKNSSQILKIYNSKNELQGFMPVFKNESSNVIAQSTMYIPYGGPVLFKLPDENRNKIRYIREIEKDRPDLKYGKQCVSISYNKEEDFLFFEKKAKEFITYNIKGL